MRFLLLVLALMMMVPTSVNARDEYYKSGVTWNQQITVKPNIDIQSVPLLSKSDIRTMHRTYKLTKKLFFRYWLVEPNQCSLGRLKIKVVRNHFDLSNRTYFPGEAQYADPPGEGTAVIFGRYFRKANTLYVVQPDEIKYYWKRDFAHEVLHYLFDECEMKFSSDNMEHQRVHEFLQEHKSTFE